MGRPADWSPLNLNSDPIPGDPDVVSAAGHDYVEIANAIKRAADNILTVTADDASISEAVDAFRDDAIEVSHRIRRAYERYHGVGEAMLAYAAPLRSAQATSIDALNDAVAAEGAGGSPQRRGRHYNWASPDPATPPANLPSV